MPIPQSFIDELRVRLPVSEVVGKRIKLRKAGREWKGLSPFNQEKTPSFFCNDQKQAWFDFSSGRNGTIFDFVMATEGLTFPEAVERLAGMAGLPMPKRSRDEAKAEEHRRTLYEVLELAARFFEQTLVARAGVRGRGYCADRGIDPATQMQFRIGYALAERFALKEVLGAQGITTETMIEAGLLVHGEDIPVPYDRFRERVMFPITDLRGRIVGFGGRALHPDAKAKYLNSPETALFHKGSLLFNGAAARKAAHEGAKVFVVEGYIDAIAMAKVGYGATVAPLGTALTEEQLALLWRMTDEPVVCFDGDPAGRRAAYRAIDTALPHLAPGKSLMFAVLPNGRDPDDVIRGGGREAMAAVLGGARPLADLLWQRETEAGGFETPERRAALEARIEGLVATIVDRKVRHHYSQDLRNRCWHLFKPAGRAASRRAIAITNDVVSSRVVRDGAATELAILAALLRWPRLIDEDPELAASLEFVDPEVGLAHQALLTWAAGEAMTDARSVLAGAGFADVLARTELVTILLPDGDGLSEWWQRAVTLSRAQAEQRAAAAALHETPDEEAMDRLRAANAALESALAVPVKEAT